MYTILSELDEYSSLAITNLWSNLWKTCHLKEIYSIPTPHFSWFIADELDLKQSKQILSDIANQQHAFSVHAFGLGIFTGDTPILYIPMAKNQRLFMLHGEIWDQMKPYCHNVNTYYSPDLWLPHITLALDDISIDNLACAINSVWNEAPDMDISVENIILAKRDELESGKILDRFKFSFH